MSEAEDAPFGTGSAALSVVLAMSHTGAVALQVGEGLLMNVLRGIDRWLPGGAAAPWAVRRPNGGMLPMWAGGALLGASRAAVADLLPASASAWDVT